MNNNKTFQHGQQKFIQTTVQNNPASELFLESLNKLKSSPFNDLSPKFFKNNSEPPPATSHLPDLPQNKYHTNEELFQLIANHPDFDLVHYGGEYRNKSHKNPSLSVNREKAVYYDHRTGKSGHLATLCKKLGLFNTEQTTVIRQNPSQISPPSPPELKKENKGSYVYHNSRNDFETVRDYFKSRGIELNIGLAKQIGFRVNHYDGKIGVVYPIKTPDDKISQCVKIALNRAPDSEEPKKQNLGNAVNQQALLFGDLKTCTIHIFEGIENALTFYIHYSDQNCAVAVTSGKGGFSKLSNIIKSYTERVLYLDPDKNHESIIASICLNGEVKRLIPTLETDVDINKAHQQGKGRKWLKSLRAVTLQECVERKEGKLTLSDIFHKDNKTLSITKYVNKHSQRITEILADDQNYNISAPTGTGKTYSIIKAALDDKHLKTDKFRNIRLILCAPYVPLCEQTANKHNIEYLVKGQNPSDSLSAVSVATYDSLVYKIIKKEKYRDQLEEIVLVIDEAHHLFTDNNFKPEIIQKLTSSLHLFKKVIFMTGTGEGLLDGKYKTIRFQPSNPAATYEQVKVYRYGKLAIKKLVPLLTDNYQKGKIQIIFINNVDKLRQIEKTLISKGFDRKKISILHGKDKENPSFKSIIENERLPDDCEFVLTTKVIEDGVSIHDDRISHIYAIDIHSITELRQMAARARKRYKCLHILKRFDTQNVARPYYDIEEKFEEEKNTFNEKYIPYLKEEHRRYKDKPINKALKNFNLIKDHHADLLYNQEEPELNPYALRHKIFQDFQDQTSNTPESFIKLFVHLERIPEKTISFQSDLRKEADIRPDKEANPEDLKSETLDLLEYDAYSFVRNFRKELPREITNSIFFDKHDFPEAWPKDDVYFEKHKTLVKDKTAIKTIRAFIFLENFLNEKKAFGLLRHLPLDEHQSFLFQIDAIICHTAYIQDHLTPKTARYIIGYDSFKFIVKEYKNGKLKKFNYPELVQKVNKHLSRKTTHKSKYLGTHQASNLIKALFELKATRPKKRIGDTRKTKRAKLYTAINAKNHESINTNFNLPQNLKLQWKDFLSKI